MRNDGKGLNGITDAGAEKLAAGLALNRGIAVLDIRKTGQYHNCIGGNKIGEKGRKVLEDARKAKVALELSV